jgi:hypothetical protein
VCGVLKSCSSGGLVDCLCRGWLAGPVAAGWRVRARRCECRVPNYTAAATEQLAVALVVMGSSLRTTILSM